MASNMTKRETTGDGVLPERNMLAILMKQSAKTWNLTLIKPLDLQTVGEPGMDRITMSFVKGIDLKCQFNGSTENRGTYK